MEALFMNSNSRYLEDNYYEPCRKDRRDHDDRDRDRDKKNQEVALKCSAPGSVAIPILADPGSTFTPTSLTVNTKKFCDPCTKLEFTSNITLPVGFLGTLSFQIFKQCRNQFTPVPVGPAFTFARTVALVVGESSTFSFFVCDCDTCNDDCCTYSIVITNQTAILLGATITNATLSALTVENKCNC
jgi:hypothetical protein